MLEINLKIDDKTLYDMWFMKRELSPHTQRLYYGNMQHFLKNMNMDLTQFYHELHGKKTIDTLTEYQILKYFEELKQKRSVNTVNLRKMTLKSFCSTFNLPCPTIKIKKQGLSMNYRRNIKKEEIQALIKDTSLRNKAVVNTTALSGMGANEIRHITLQDIVQCINDELNTDYTDIFEVLCNKDTVIEGGDCFPFLLERLKVNHVYTTFIANESMNLILEYLDTLSKDKINETPFLFRKRNNEPFSYVTQNSIQTSLARKNGFDCSRKKRQYNLFAPHQLRRYFYSIVLSTVGVVYADLWTGHKLNDVRSAYTRVNDTMKEKYLECLPKLSLIEYDGLTCVQLEEYNMLKEKQREIERSYELLEKIALLKNL